MSATDAAALLGVKRETLYAYAARGLVRTAPGGSGVRSRIYQREDLERLKTRSRARSGHGAVAAGALRWGEPVLETRIGAIGERGPLYRGKPAIDLASEHAPFEDVCGLLWAAPFTRDRVAFGLPARSLRALIGPSAGPFDAMLVTAAALAAAGPRGDVASMMKTRGGALVRRLVASVALARGPEFVAEAFAADTVAESLFLALGATPRARRTRSLIEALNDALVLCADHELNASTFAVRVAASSGANLGAAIVAGLASLSGPLHGAMTARVEALVSEVGRPESAASVVSERLARGEAIPGFGHPLYPSGDPRGLFLLAAAKRIRGSARPVRVLVALTEAMERLVGDAPTLDVGLVALAAALRLPRGAAMAIFASGRLAGYVAHAVEQREEGHLLRPRARYIGA